NLRKTSSGSSTSCRFTIRTSHGRWRSAITRSSALAALRCPPPASKYRKSSFFISTPILSWIGHKLLAGCGKRGTDTFSTAVTHFPLPRPVEKAVCPPFSASCQAAARAARYTVCQPIVALSSATYFVFLTAIFFLYWPVARVRTLGLSVLLFANYFFYTRWGIPYLFLIPAASTCDFLIGLGLQYFQNGFLRRLLVGLSLTVNLGLLVTLKFQISPVRHWELPLALS